MQWKYILRCIGGSLFRTIIIRKQWSDRGQRTKGQQCRLVLSPNHGSVLCAALVMKWSFINPQRTRWFCSKAVTEQDGEGVMVMCNESGLKPGSSPYLTAKYVVVYLYWDHPDQAISITTDLISPVTLVTIIINY